MTEDQLTALEAKARAATSGPWEANVVGNEIVQPFFTRKGDGTPKRDTRKDRKIVSLGDDGGCSDPECCGGPSYHVQVSPLDAEHIAANSPDVTLALIAALREARVEQERLRQVNAALTKSSQEKP